MKKNTFLTAIIVGLAVVITLTAFITMGPWIIVYFGLHSLSDPPKPEITYGEFPFRLEYEINGERKVIQDTLICEFDGIGISEGLGKYRKWKEHLASGKDDVVLLEIDNPAPDGYERIVKQDITYPIGSAYYYMGDVEEDEIFSECFPDASYYLEYEDGGSDSGVIRADELLEKYHLKLIKWDYTQPIKNHFPSTKK